MATVKVVDLIARAATILHDDAVRWPLVELQDWLNDAYRELVIIRPAASSTVGTHNCTAGPRQTLAQSDAILLLDVTRNTAATSTKRAVRSVPKSELDGQLPAWYDETEDVNVQLFMHDPAVPKQFLVYPPVTSAGELEVVYSVTPTAHAISEVNLANPATADVISVDDFYATVLLDLILYRAYSKDTATASAERAAFYKSQAMAPFTQGAG